VSGTVIGAQDHSPAAVIEPVVPHNSLDRARGHKTMRHGNTGAMAFHRDGRTQIHTGGRSGSVGGTTAAPSKAAVSPAIIEIDASQGDASLMHAIAQAIEGGQTFFLSPLARQGDGTTGAMRCWPQVPKARAGCASLDSFGCPVFGVLSGGTTGAPKRILRSHQSWICSFLRHGQWWDLSHRDTYGILGTIAHSWALFGALEALHLGADLHLMSALMPKQQIELIRTGSISVLYATPAQLRRLVRQAPKAMTCAVRLITVCGSRLDADLGAAARTIFPAAQLIEFYGTSETSFVSMRDVAAMPVDGVGTLYPGVALKFSKTESEIRVKSPLLALGEIVDTQGATDRMVHQPVVRTLDRDAEGFLATGECGHQDEAGHLVIEGRLDRRYTVADITVDPEAIETLLMAMDGVADATVYPAADAARGSVSHADVLIDAQTGVKSTIRTVCRQHLGALLAPRAYRFFTDPTAFRHAGHARPTLKT